MKNNTTQQAEREQEAKALDRLITLLTALTIAAVSFSAVYYVAAAQLTAIMLDQ